MWMLALDSSTEGCSAAVGDGRQWHVRDEHAGSRHSERLLPLVRAVLAEAGLALGHLDGIAFGAGPGSFTGIRIGCGVAQGLAFGAGLPLVPVSTLDARMREVYAGLYAAEGAAWRAETDAAAVRPEAMSQPPAGAGCFGAGNGFRAYPALAPQLGRIATDAGLRPTARAIGELALPRLAAGEGVGAAAGLPVYVRHRVALTTAERDAGLRL